MGNQIFQVYYLYCLQYKTGIKEIVHIHSTNYDRFADWEFPAIFGSRAPTYTERFLSSLRLMPIMRFIPSLSGIGSIKIGKYIIIDGYYQQFKFYSIFGQIELKKSQILMRQMLGINAIEQIFNSSVCHLRLGDFYGSINEEIRYLINSIELLCDGASIITNKEDLFYSNKDISSLLLDKSIILLNTRNLDSLQLIRLFSSFSEIISSGSSLSAAAVLFCPEHILFTELGNLKGRPKLFYDDFKALINFLR